MRSAAPGITGSTSAATTRSVSAEWYRVTSSVARWSGFFASAQGSRLTMYWLTARMSSHVSWSESVI